MQCHIAKHHISSRRNMHFGQAETTSDRTKRHLMKHNRTAVLSRQRTRLCSLHDCTPWWDFQRNLLQLSKPTLLLIVDRGLAAVLPPSGIERSPIRSGQSGAVADSKTGHTTPTTCFFLLTILVWRRRRRRLRAVAAFTWRVINVADTVADRHSLYICFARPEVPRVPTWPHHAQLTDIHAGRSRAVVSSVLLWCVFVSADTFYLCPNLFAVYHDMAPFTQQIPRTILILQLSIWI